MSPTDLPGARDRFPVTRDLAYLASASIGLASDHLASVQREFNERWIAEGIDFTLVSPATESARNRAASIMGTVGSELALIPTVSAAAGLITASLGTAPAGGNVVIGAAEFSSNHFPWRILARCGWEVRQVGFVDGGVTPDALSPLVDRNTAVVAFSSVQSATGHRSQVRELAGIARSAGAKVFVDGAQSVGALSCADWIGEVDVLMAPDHKFLMNGGRGMGYCWIHPDMQENLVPHGAGWQAAADPDSSFYGPDMELAEDASLFDHSVIWQAAVGSNAALAVYDDFAPDEVYAHNEELGAYLHSSLTEIGLDPTPMPAANRSHVVSVAVDNDDLVRQGLAERGVIVSARAGNLRAAVHLYNNTDDVDRLCAGLREILGR